MLGPSYGSDLRFTVICVTGCLSVGIAAWRNLPGIAAKGEEFRDEILPPIAHSTARPPKAPAEHLSRLRPVAKLSRQDRSRSKKQQARDDTDHSL